MVDFQVGCEILEEMVGNDELVGEYRVVKVYAAVQHEMGWENYLGAYGPKRIRFYHGGGGAKFVEQPLKANFPRYYQDMANSVLEGKLPDAMEDALQDQDRQLQTHAPEDDGELKRAGAYTVTDNGRLVSSKSPQTTYEDENPGNPPGGVIGLLKKAGKL